MQQITFYRKYISKEEQRLFQKPRKCVTPYFLELLPQGILWHLVTIQFFCHWCRWGRISSDAVSSISNNRNKDQLLVIQLKKLSKSCKIKTSREGNGKQSQKKCRYEIKSCICSQQVQIVTDLFMQTKSDGQKRIREESGCRGLICHLSLECWWIQQWFISLTEAELKWTYGSNVWTLMMSNSSSLPLWIRFTSCSTRQSVRDVRGKKSPKMNRGGKRKVIKQLQFQRACFYFSSFFYAEMSFCLSGKAQGVQQDYGQ